MEKSDLQEPFLSELVETFLATSNRISRRLAEESDSDPKRMIDDELRGLYHGILTIFDGGTALADQGLIRIVDDQGIPFIRYLHEVGMDHWPREN